MSAEQAISIVQVLATPLGNNPQPMGAGVWVMHQREKIAARYRELQTEHPDWSFSQCSDTARAEWLQERLAKEFSSAS